jgi:hypothetical protein
MARIPLNGGKVLEIAGVGELVEVNDGVFLKRDPVEDEVGSDESGTAGDKDGGHDDEAVRLKAVRLLGGTTERKTEGGNLNQVAWKRRGRAREAGPEGRRDIREDVASNRKYREDGGHDHQAFRRGKIIARDEGRVTSRQNERS